MCIDFVDDIKFSIDYASFEDVCKHFDLDESMREVLFKRLKQVDGIAIYKNKTLVNLNKFYNAIMVFKDLPNASVKPLNWDISSIKNKVGASKPINETVKEETAKILVNLIKEDIDNNKIK